jgi:hypothetical protein
MNNCGSTTAFTGIPIYSRDTPLLTGNIGYFRVLTDTIVNYRIV